MNFESIQTITLDEFRERRARRDNERWRTVVGIDPPMHLGPGNACGIVVAAKRDHYTAPAYVLASRSMEPKQHDQWVRAAEGVLREFEADLIVIHGGLNSDVLRTIISMYSTGLPVRLINPAQGRQIRTLKLDEYYRFGRVIHVGAMPELEEQMRSQGCDKDGADALMVAIEYLLTPSLEPRRAL